jgi:hypothetical protein
MWKDQSWLMVLIYAAFAGFGGSLGYIIRALDRKEMINPWRVAVEGGAAAFVGVLVMLVCQAMKLSPQWTGVIVGVMGWLGASAAMRMLELVAFRKLGVQNDGSNNPPKSDG